MANQIASLENRMREQGSFVPAKKSAPFKVEITRIGSDNKYAKQVLSDEGEVNEDGGPGSGNWHHAGNPGHVGGSAPTVSSKDASNFGKPGTYKVFRSGEIFESHLGYLSFGLEKSQSYLYSKDKNMPIESYSVTVSNPKYVKGSDFNDMQDELCKEYAGRSFREGKTLEEKRAIASKMSKALSEKGYDSILLEETDELSGEKRYEVGVLNDSLSTIHHDGGPGSGNHGHAGIPGQRGGSAPSANGLTKSVNSAIRSGDEDKIMDTVKSAVASMPVGGSMTFADSTTTRVADDKWESDSPFGDRFTTTPEEVAESIAYWEGEPSEAKFSFPHSNQTVPDVERQGVVVLKSEQATEKFQSMLNKQKAVEGKSDLSEEEFSDMVRSVRDYGSHSPEILAAQAPQMYKEYIDAFGEGAVKKYEGSAERLERYISLSEPQNGPLYRGMSFNDSSPNGKAMLDRTLSRLKPGEEFSMGHIASWSTNRYTAERYSESVVEQELPGQNYSVVFHLSDNKSAVSVRDINPEGECISPKKARYRVRSVKHRYEEELANHSYSVELEEL